MYAKRSYISWSSFDAENVQFALTQDRQGRNKIVPTYGGMHMDVALITPACVTNWPRVNGDGNFGTMWGPSEIENAKYTLDLCDSTINDTENTDFASFAAKMEALDDKFLDFMQSNQLRLLGRKNLSRDELKMLQFRCIRTKYDKFTGAKIGYAMNLSTPRCVFDNKGAKVPRSIPICGADNNVIPGAVVTPGDVVAALAHISTAYVIGDKFGMHWAFDTVKIVCQSKTLNPPTTITAFGNDAYAFSAPYSDPTPSSSEVEVLIA